MGCEWGTVQCNGTDKLTETTQQSWQSQAIANRWAGRLCLCLPVKWLAIKTGNSQYRTNMQGEHPSRVDSVLTWFGAVCSSVCWKLLVTLCVPIHTQSTNTLLLCTSVVFPSLVSPLPLNLTRHFSLWLGNEGSRRSVWSTQILESKTE